jgi:thiamine biosynthesis lipoprotein
MTATTEISETFACFGSTCAVYVGGEADGADAEAAVARVKERMLDWHGRFTRFEPSSELSALNCDPRATVPVSPAMRDFIRAVVAAAEHTAGLVDATLLDEVQTAGYGAELGAPLPLPLALRLAPPRRAAGAGAHWRSRRITVDDERGTVTRPPGVKFDSGGLAKGLFADLLGQELACYGSFAISCGGDLRVGGSSGALRAVEVASPFDGSVLHTFSLARGGVATSGIGRRSWLDGSGAPAHHLLDPASGRPAYTGVVQVTALASSAVDAEMRAKAALLSGPEGAPAWLPDGGAIVLEDESCHVLTAAPALQGNPNV